MNKTIYFLIVALITLSCNSKSKIKKPLFIDNEIFSMTEGDTTINIFAPGIISTAHYERDFTINPDGDELFYTIMSRGFSVIVTSKKVNNKWSQPEVASFSGSKDYFDAEPHITPDGTKLMFLSTRPNKGEEAKPGWANQNIWICNKTENGWGEPYKISNLISSEKGEYFPSVTKNGTLYYTKEEGQREQYIYRSKLVNGKYSKPEKLPETINQSRFQFNACIAPDESYIIVCTQLKENNIGTVDYAISYRDNNDNWTQLKSIGHGINFEGSVAVSPYITPDGKFFVFSQARKSDKEFTKYNMNIINNLLTECQNGSSDLYWISTEILKK